VYGRNETRYRCTKQETRNEILVPEIPTGLLYAISLYRTCAAHCRTGILGCLTFGESGTDRNSCPTNTVYDDNFNSRNDFAGRAHAST